MTIRSAFSVVVLLPFQVPTRNYHALRRTGHSRGASAALTVVSEFYKAAPIGFLGYLAGGPKSAFAAACAVKVLCDAIHFAGLKPDRQPVATTQGQSPQ